MPVVFEIKTRSDLVRRLQEERDTLSSFLWKEVSKQISIYIDLYLIRCQSSPSNFDDVDFQSRNNLDLEFLLAVDVRESLKGIDLEFLQFLLLVVHLS